MFPATKQIRAVSHTGNGQGAALPQIAQGWLSRLKSYFAWEKLMVAGREVKGFVVSPTIAAVILGAMLTAIGTVYWRMSDRIADQNRELRSQSELLIRLDQRLIDKNDRDKEKKEELEKRLQNIDAVQIVLGRDLAKLQAQRGN
jgi:hypothetical protein